MYVVRRLIGIGFLAGIGLICVGTYDVFIQVTAQRNPETISISDLQKRIPWNRHLIITGGTAMVPETIEYYKYENRYGRKARLPNSEIYFIPVQHSSASQSASKSPTLVVRMTKEQADKVKAHGGFPETRIEGLRMTHWDLESEAKEALVSSFGKSAVEKMVVLDYQHEVVGIWRGLGQILSGLLLLGALGIASVKLNKSRPAMPQARVPSSLLRAPPSPLPKTYRAVGSSRKRMAFIVIASAIGLLLCIALFSKDRWRQIFPMPAASPGSEWRDWQLPIRIGDSVEAVRSKLGQESYDGNRLMDKYEKTHHLGGYGNDMNRLKLAAEGTMTLYWQDRGLAVSFQKGRAKDITVYTADRPDRENDVRVRKYEGPIIGGVTAADRFEDLLSKLGKPSEVSDFNPNDKDYLWRRKDYVITTRIAMEDLVTVGLPFKAHQMEGTLRIEDIAPYLQAERDKQLQAEALQKEKALVAMTGAALTPKEIFQKYAGRVVEIQALNSRGKIIETGTGFMWKGNEVLTNCHIVEKGRALKVARAGMIEDAFFAITAKLVGSLQVAAGSLPLIATGLAGETSSHFSSDQDWVQLFLEKTKDLPPVVAATDLPEVGESVTVIGNPERLTNSLSTGVVAGIRDVEGNNWIQITAPLSPGSSGSPVFDSKGRLIGLATKMIVNGQNLNFATPITQIAAGLVTETTRDAIPFRALGIDKEFEEKKWALRTPQEIAAFAEEFRNKYSDPHDKARLFDAVATAYEVIGKFRTAAKVVQQKMQELGTEAGDYETIARLFGEAGDSSAMKREAREGIMCGARQFAKQQFPDWSTAWILGQLFDKLQDRDGAERWFDIYVGLLAGGWDAVNPDSLPQWYRSKWLTHEKTEADLDQLIPKDAEAYIGALRQRWRSQVEKEVVALLQSWGLPEEKSKQFLRIGIDSIPAAYWEEQIRPKLTSDQWLLLRAKLDERKSL
jgi:Trypsin-like peptidase domain